MRICANRLRSFQTVVFRVKFLVAWQFVKRENQTNNRNQIDRQIDRNFIKVSKAVQPGKKESLTNLGTPKLTDAS